MKTIPERSITIFCWLSVIITSIAVLILIIFLLIKGAPSISLRLIFGDVNPIKAILLKERVFEGIFPAILGTLLVVMLSMAFAIPVGVAAGIYLAEFSSVRLKNIFNFSMDILASIPSIVIGLFGLTTAIFLHRYLSPAIGPCLLISSIALSILVLPYVVRTTHLSIESVPYETRMAGISSGASRFQNLYHVVLPSAIPGILSGVILAVGRAAEDTAVIMLTGVVATAGIPSSLLEKYEALPFFIYYISSQYTDQGELMQGFGAAIILLIVCSILFVFAHAIKRILSGRFSE